jgi:hypothetical protein
MNQSTYKSSAFIIFETPHYFLNSFMVEMLSSFSRRDLLNNTVFRLL